jgi:hypothetical protein
MSDESPLQSSVNVFVDWAKARLDEMAANASTLQQNLDKLDAQSRAQAEQAIAQMNQWIEQGQNDIKTAQAQGEAQVAQAKADMETLWANFQNNAGDWAGLAKDNQAMFQARAQAQIQAWQDAVNAYVARANQVHEKNKAQAEAQVAQLQADAKKAQADLTAKLDELTKAGQSSWAAMSDALDQSRNAFTKSIETAARNFNDAMKS